MATSPTKATSPPPTTITPPPQPSTPKCTAGLLLRVLGLIARLFTFICLLISLVLITVTSDDGLGDEYQLKFNVFYAYRYMMASTVIGIVYTFAQCAFNIFKVSTGNRVGGAGFYLLDFYCDKVLSYLLATGAAAGFGLSVDLKRIQLNDSSLTDFLNKGNTGASLLLLGFVFSAVSSVFSSLALPKRG